MKDEVVERMDGLVDQSDLGEFKQSIELMSCDLLREGFDRQDILTYLTNILNTGVRR